MMQQDLQVFEHPLLHQTSVTPASRRLDCEIIFLVTGMCSSPIIPLVSANA
jgi:hypothetical protein